MKLTDKEEGILKEYVKIQAEFKILKKHIEGLKEQADVLI